MKKLFPFKLTSEQEKVFKQLTLFINNPNDKIFILKGYAGTGKTSLMSGLIKHITKKKKTFCLLASTGRAAKILSDKTGEKAKTIHSKIYSFNKLSQSLEELHQKKDKELKENNLNLLFDLNTIGIKDSNKNIIYIVDESSMIANRKKTEDTSFAKFGDGRLLSDLIKYDKRGKFIFLGDPCQLPPINEETSPALDIEYIKKNITKNVKERMLYEIKRQNNNNGIITSSLRIRELYNNNNNDIKWPKLPLRNSKNIDLVSSELELVDVYLKLIKKKGLESSTIICQTNKDCRMINSLIRRSLFSKPDILEVKDLIQVTQNNHNIDLVNGDLILIKTIGKREYRCGLIFLEVEIEEMASGHVFHSFIIEDILSSDKINLSQEKQKDLMLDYFLRMKEKGIFQKTKLFKDLMKVDPYLNAIRGVYGYALSCHKSQGGEWDNVFLYIKKSMYVMKKPGLYQWWYTAITRAKKKLITIDEWWIN